MKTLSLAKLQNRLKEKTHRGGIMMSTTSHLPEFMDYLGHRQDMKPDKTFEARGAAEAFEPPSGLFWINAFTQPFFSSGKVFLYPEYLAFLTTMKHSGGAAAFREEATHNLIDFVKNEFMLHRWLGHPASAILDIAKILAKAKDTQIVIAALSNPLSFFIPLSKIKEVKTGGGYVQGFKDKRSFVDFQPPYIRITTDETSYVIYAPTEFSFWNFTNFKRSYHMISSKWQTDVAQLLEASAMANNL